MLRTREDRFWAKVDKADGCWLWTGATSDNGYGNFAWDLRPDLKAMGAHRASWLIAFGDIPQGLCVLHVCDVRNCVRPDHLFLGTHLDNYADMRAKGREPIRTGGGRRTHCIHGHAFTPENTHVYANGDRRCRACHRENERRRLRKKKTQA